MLTLNSVYSQNFNRPVPDDIYSYEFQSNGYNEDGYFLAGLFKFGVLPNSPNFKGAQPVIFDKNGYVVWYSPEINCFDFKYHSLENKYSFATNIQTLNLIVELDEDFHVIDTVRSVNQPHDNHDYQYMQNGNRMIMTRYYEVMDLSAFQFDGSQGSDSTIIRGIGYQELDLNGNLVSQWNSNDFIHPTEAYDFYGYNVNDFDYNHANAVEEDVDGHILISFRHLNSVYKINRNTGAVIWRLGGKSSDFTFTNDSGFSAQHDIRRLPNGNYSLFDNANMAPAPRNTRGVEYVLDTINWAATKINEVLYPTQLYARAMGSYQNINNDFSVLGYGYSLRPNPSATVFDNNNNISAEWHFQDSVFTYRMIHSDAPVPQQPEISCNWNGTNWELVAPVASTYKWSTGETTQTIQLTQPGTYQAYLPHGIGFLATQPLEISDINNPCGNLGIQELTEDFTGSYDLFDLLGRKIENPQLKNVYIQRFDNGSQRKIIYTNL